MRRALTISSLAVALLLLSAWCLTLRYTIAGSIGSFGISFHEGRVYGGWWPGADGLKSYTHDWAAIFPARSTFTGFFETRMHWGFDFYFKPGVYVAYIPLWCPFLLSAALFAVTARRRRARGSCPKCGYDIRGLSACPECGQTVMESRARV